MIEINKYGLKRRISPDIKSQVRKECGFGCVVCGFWICEYDHFDPEFADAMSHDPNGIALLCGSHHEAKTKGLLTNDQVRLSRNSPYNIEHGMKNNELFFTSKPLLFLCGNEIIDGGSIIANLKFTSPFRVTWKERNETKMEQELFIPIINIGKPRPEEPIPMHLSFFDSEENFDPIFEIENNEWHGNINNFDIESIGTNLIIRKRKGKILLSIDFRADENRIDIDNIEVTLPGMTLKRFLYSAPNEYGINLNGLKIYNSKIVGKVTPGAILRNTPGQFEIIRE
jgi:hypothetical protein